MRLIYWAILAGLALVPFWLELPWQITAVAALVALVLLFRLIVKRD